MMMMLMMMMMMMMIRLRNKYRELMFERHDIFHDNKMMVMMMMLIAMLLPADRRVFAAKFAMPSHRIYEATVMYLRNWGRHLLQHQNHDTYQTEN